MSESLSLGAILVAITHRRKKIRNTREELVSASSQVAKLIREAYQFANPAEAGAGQPARDAALKNTQAIDSALQAIDMHLAQIAAHVRKAADTVDEAQAQRKHAASTYRV